MRYRALSSSGDYVFGRGTGEFLLNSPEAVAQAVETRLRLMTGEWFLNLDEGTPYSTEILGTGTQTLYDQAIQDRILGTQGVQSIDDYTSTLNSATRQLTVECTITTIYGQASVTQVL
jgi:hypothetical protein